MYARVPAQHVYIHVCTCTSPACVYTCMHVYLLCKRLCWSLCLLSIIQPKTNPNYWDGGWLLALRIRTLLHFENLSHLSSCGWDNSETSYIKLNKINQQTNKETKYRLNVFWLGKKRMCDQLLVYHLVSIFSIKTNYLIISIYVSSDFIVKYYCLWQHWNHFVFNVTDF